MSHFCRPKPPISRPEGLHAETAKKPEKKQRYNAEDRYGNWYHSNLTLLNPPKLNLLKVKT